MGELRDLPYEEYIQDLKKELATKGLRNAIKERCDEIAGECRPMSYATTSIVYEMLAEILTFVELETGEFDDRHDESRCSEETSNPRGREEERDGTAGTESGAGHDDSGDRRGTFLFYQDGGGAQGHFIRGLRG